MKWAILVVPSKATEAQTCQVACAYFVARGNRCIDFIMNVITDTQSLAAFCETLRTTEYITVDTEFMREKTFWSILCLIQVAGPNEAAAIDPRATGIDLAPLFALLADPKILKVMHGARQDVEIFYHLMGEMPAALYDTQIAAMVCGFGDQVGYETLISRLTGETLDKSSRFTDWSLRPLTDKQLRYALDDVVHLRPAYEKLRDTIGNHDRASWLAEEMTALSDPTGYDTDPQNAWRRLKPRTTNARHLAILQTIAAWRENQAMGRDLPRGRILRDEALHQIAAHPPTSLDALAKMRGVSRGFAEGKLGDSLIAAIKEGLAMDPDNAPAPLIQPERAAGTGPLVDLLKVLLKHKCEHHHVAQKLIANSADLEEIAARDMSDRNANDVRAMHGWRFDVFGADALRLKNGELALAAVGSKINLVEVNGAGIAEFTGPPAPKEPAPIAKARRRRRRNRRGSGSGEPQNEGAREQIAD